MYSSHTKKNLSILLVVLICFPLLTCKKFHTTNVMGQLINLPTNKPIVGETMVLGSVQTGAILIPEKANVALTTLTDNNGIFSFKFEAFEPTLNQRQPEFIVYWANLSQKKAAHLLINYDGHNLSSLRQIPLWEVYNTDLSSAKKIQKTGAINHINFNPVILGTLSVKCKNELPTASITDTCEIRIINSVDDFFFGYHIGTGTKIMNDENYIGLTPLIQGTTTIKAIIKKNNQTIIRDTTFFVEDKEYYLEYRY